MRHKLVIAILVFLPAMTLGVCSAQEAPLTQPMDPGYMVDDRPLLDMFKNSDDKLFGLFAHSDDEFCNFISPMSNPIFFEDPRTLTEARALFINQQLPDSLGGDNVQVYAMQLRMALTERLSIIATKDGFIVSQSPLLDDGWADVALGLKYNLIRDPDSQRILKHRSDVRTAYRQHAFTAGQR